jgi:hypothetical protein
MSYVWRKIRYGIRYLTVNNDTQAHTFGEKLGRLKTLEKNPVCFLDFFKVRFSGLPGESTLPISDKHKVLGAADAYIVGLLQTTEQTRTVERARPQLGGKSGMKIQVGEKSGMFGGKSGENGNEFGIDTPTSQTASASKPTSPMLAWHSARDPGPSSPP